MNFFDLYPTHGAYGSNAKHFAQQALAGRTHYVDEGSLRFHHARVLRAQGSDNGLLFALVESVALDMDNTKRGYRYVIFDVFGTVVGTRASLDEAYKTSARAVAAMRAELSSLDAYALTREGLARAERQHTDSVTRLRDKLTALEAKPAA